MSGISLGFRASSGAVTVLGNGVVVHNKGRLAGRSMVGTAPVVLDNPDGISGHVRITARPANHPLASADDLDGNSIADQPVKIFGADTFIIRRIVFLRASSTPATVQGGLYTLPGKSGRTLVAATQVFTALTDDKAILVVDYTEPVVMRVPWLYFSPSVAEGSALTLAMRVYGDVVDHLEG